MRRLFSIIALVASVMFVVGCQPDNPTPEPTPGDKTKPQITLTAVEATQSTFTFEVETTIPGTLGYAVVAKGFDNPTFDEMFARNSKEVTSKETITIENLNGGTEYAVFAILRANDTNILSNAQKLSFTTEEDNSNSPIKIKNIGYDKVTFSIELPGNILFQCIDKAYLEYMGLTVESYFTTEGIAIRDSGPVEIEWVNGNRYGDYEMRMTEDSDYYIIAAKSDGSTPYPNITSEIYVKEFRTLRKPVSDAGLTTQLSDITSTSVRIATTPDSSVTEYYVWVRTVQDYDYYVSAGGEAIVRSMIQRGDSGSWHLTAANDAVCEGLTPETDHYCLILVKDNKGAESFSKIPFTTTGKNLSAPEITLSITEPQKNPHNTLNLNIYSEGAASAKVVFRPTADVAERRAEGYSDEYIVENMGTPLSASQVESIATTGLSIVMEELWPEVEYTALVCVKNAEQTASYKATTHYTPAQAPAPRVESELFTSLLGEWVLTYDLIQENLVEARVSEVVTIAQGVDAKTNTDYRNQNRLVILGFPFEVSAQGVYQQMPVFLPADLKEARPNYYKYGENLIYRDYGPKIFLEIAADGTITVPTSRACHLYNWSSDGSVDFYGCDYENEFIAPATFPVTISADGNTLSIGACHSGEEFGYGVYRPSVFLNNTDTPQLQACALSDIILTRVK